MTDAELDDLTQRAIDGTLSEEEYDRLTNAAIANSEAILASPARLAEVARTAFVPAPKRIPVKRPRRSRASKMDDERSFGPAGRPPGFNYDR